MMQNGVKTQSKKGSQRKKGIVVLKEEGERASKLRRTHTSGETGEKM